MVDVAKAPPRLRHSSRPSLRATPTMQSLIARLDSKDGFGCLPVGIINAHLILICTLHCRMMVVRVHTGFAYCYRSRLHPKPPPTLFANRRQFLSFDAAFTHTWWVCCDGQIMDTKTQTLNRVRVNHLFICCCCHVDVVGLLGRHHKTIQLQADSRPNRHTVVTLCDVL